MTLEIELNGRSRTVLVERQADGRYRITADGVTQTIDAVQPRPGTWSIVDAHHRSYEVVIGRGAAPGELSATLDGQTLALLVNGRRVRRGGSGVSAEGVHKVVAPMPGKVLRVLVQVGDTITARQPLVVVEAMKMENELSSPRPGRVTDIEVEPGASVEAGRLLLVVE
jgi:biotin carboxyl carrier protein